MFYFKDVLKYVSISQPYEHSFNRNKEFFRLVNQLQKQVVDLDETVQFVDPKTVKALQDILLKFKGVEVPEGLSKAEIEKIVNDIVDGITIDNNVTVTKVQTMIDSALINIGKGITQEQVRAIAQIEISKSSLGEISEEDIARIVDAAIGSIPPAVIDMEEIRLVINEEIDKIPPVEVMTDEQVKLIVQSEIALQDAPITELEVNHLIETAIALIPDGITREEVVTLVEDAILLIPAYDDESIKTLINAKQDPLTAGSNVSIDLGVVSATDTIYDDGPIRALISDKGGALTAGENVSILDGVISATDTDTIYDDAEIRGLIESKTDTDTVYDDTIVKGLIDKKIDKPEEEGTSGQVLTYDINNNIVWKNAVIPDTSLSKGSFNVISMSSKNTIEIKEDEFSRPFFEITGSIPLNPMIVSSNTGPNTYQHPSAEHNGKGFKKNTKSFYGGNLPANGNPDAGLQMLYEKMNVREVFIETMTMTSSGGDYIHQKVIDANNGSIYERAGLASAWTEFKLMSGTPISEIPPKA